MNHRHLCARQYLGASGSPRSSARPFRLPGDRPQWGRARPFVLTALCLDVRPDLERRSIDGVANLTFERVDPEARWVELDAIAFRLEAVERLTAEDQKVESAPFEYDGEKLRIDLSDVPDGGTAEVRVTYSVTPRRGLYFRTPDETRPDRPRQIWSQCQDQDARHWFPCQDHPGQRMKTEISVVVEKGWFALGNGVLTERTETEDGTRFVWTQSEPHPAYLVTLAAGELDEAHEDVDGLPVDYYVPKGRGEQIARSLGRTPDMIRLFSEKLQTPYPWPKYAQIVVADFTFGGMENTSATTLFERVLLDERAALDVDMDALVAHELAHQWFGDLVTCRDWSHAWLNEGFATYLEHVWKEHHEGRDAYLYGLEEDLGLYLAEHGGRYGRPVVEKVFATPIDLFDRHLYQKGGLFLHALREHMGDAAFFKGLAFYLQRHRGGSVETRDLLRALEDSSGRSLEELFHQWLERPGHPRLEVASEHADGLVKVTVTQKQAGEGKPDELFHLRLPVIVHTESGARTHVLDLTRRIETFALPSSESPTVITVDPNLTAPGTIELKLSTALLLGQLKDAKEARSRWCAARALADRNEPRALDGLAAALKGDVFWGVRAEAATALGKHRTVAAHRALVIGRSDEDPRVRRAVAGALGECPPAEAARVLLSWMKEGDRSYLVEAAIRRALGETRDASAFEPLVRSLAEDRGSWGEVVAGAAADGLSRLRDPRFVAPLLAVLEEPSSPSALRRTVIASLGRARESVSERPVLHAIRERVEGELDRPNPNIRIAVARLMTALADRMGFPVLARIEQRDLDGRVRRAARECTRDLSAQLASPPQITQLNEDVEALRREVRELRAAVAGPSAQSAGNTEKTSAEAGPESIDS